MSEDTKDTIGGGGETPAGIIDCADVRDLLPLRASSQIPLDRPDVEAHLETCSECRAEAGFVARLRECRLEPPDAILRGVLSRATAPSRVRTRRRWNLSWALAAAAGVVLALGVGMLQRSAQTIPETVWTLALEPEPATWYGDEWMVAGGPVPEALSDDVLMALLQEMDP